MAYVPPTLDDLRTSLAVDLRDPNKVVFTDTYLDSFINVGIAELNLIRPVEAFATPADDADLAAIELDYIFLVEIIRTEDSAQVIVPANSGEVRWLNGWELFGGQLILDPQWKNRIDNGWENVTHTMRVWGYRSRDPLLVYDDGAELDSIEEEVFVRRVGVLNAYRHLESDRATFMQWQTQANNSDVSPTQLMNMKAVVEADIARLSKRMFRPRRPVISGVL